MNENAVKLFIIEIGKQFSHCVCRFFSLLIYSVFIPIGHFFLSIGKFIKKNFFRIYVKLQSVFYDTVNLKDEIKQYKKSEEKKKHFYINAFKKHNSLFKLVNSVFSVFIVFCIISVGIVRLDAFSFALEVKCDGDLIGYVKDEESIFESKKSANSVLSLADKKCGKIDYKMTVVTVDKLNSTEEISESIIEKTDSSFQYSCGVYINSKFVCAVEKQSDAYDVFNKILSVYSSNDKSVTYSFNEDITCVYGLYPSNSDVLWDSRKLQTYLDNNPISIKMLKTNIYDQTVNYNVVNINSDAIYQGESMVLQQGENGTDRITELLTYIDGVQTGKSVVSKMTLKNAVSKRVAIGTRIASYKKYTQSFGGVMLWPAPKNCFYLSSYYGYRSGRLHAGIDIISSDSGSCRGRPIVAAANGVVISTQYHWSWGNYIKIDHGNGIATLYAHMLEGSFCVQEGQYVYAGQQIGAIGTTGNSTGYHLHFEVYINGTRVDPLPFVYSENIQYID